MSTNQPNPDPTAEQVSNALDEKLKCLVGVMGESVGRVLRCMVEAEVANHVRRIRELEVLLSGNTCAKDLSDD
jgi:hypothetical protein